MNWFRRIFYRTKTDVGKRYYGFYNRMINECTTVDQLREVQNWLDRNKILSSQSVATLKEQTYTRIETIKRQEWLCTYMRDLND